MITLIPFALSICLQDAPPKPDIERIQGTWVLVSLVQNGKTAAVKSRLEVKGDVYQHAINGKPMQPATLKLDENANPRIMEIRSARGVSHVIYKIEGDTLTLCVPQPKGSPLPREFRAEPGDQTLLWTFKRRIE